MIKSKILQLQNKFLLYFHWYRNLIVSNFELYFHWYKTLIASKFKFGRFSYNCTECKKGRNDIYGGGTYSCFHCNNCGYIECSEDY